MCNTCNHHSYSVGIWVTYIMFLGTGNVRIQLNNTTIVILFIQSPLVNHISSHRPWQARQLWFDGMRIGPVSAEQTPKLETTWIGLHKYRSLMLGIALFVESHVFDSLNYVLTVNCDTCQIYKSDVYPLTPCSLVTQYGDMDLGQHWLMTYLLPAAPIY